MDLRELMMITLCWHKSSKLIETRRPFWCTDWRILLYVCAVHSAWCVHVIPSAAGVGDGCGGRYLLVRCLLLTPPLLSVVRNLPCSIITVPSHDCYSFLCRDDCPSATCLWLKRKIYCYLLSCVPRKMLSSRSLRKNHSIFSFSFLSCPFFSCLIFDSNGEWVI